VRGFGNSVGTVFGTRMCVGRECLEIGYAEENVWIQGVGKRIWERCEGGVFGNDMVGE
jgi:hypothetical protein